MVGGRGEVFAEVGTTTISNGGMRRGEAQEISQHPRNIAGRSRANGSRALEESLSNAPVETDMPYSGTGPLVSNYQEPVFKERSAGFRSARPGGGSRRNVENDSQWGEILALVFAAAVGIGCGFIFLRLFAPSLLAKWHF